MTAVTLTISHHGWRRRPGHTEDYCSRSKYLLLFLEGIYWLCIWGMNPEWHSCKMKSCDSRHTILAFYNGICLTTDRKSWKTLSVAEKYLTEQCLAWFIVSNWPSFFGQPRLASWHQSCVGCASGDWVNAHYSKYLLRCRTKEFSTPANFQLKNLIFVFPCIIIYGFY